jgi:hypothetical protein
MSEVDDFVDLARTVRQAVDPQGFAILMQLGDGLYHYASNGDRKDVRKTFEEFLARVSVNVRDPGETALRAEKRLETEEKCARLGKFLESHGYRLVLFLFDFGDKGAIAWFSSAPDTRGVIESFLKTTEASNG